MRAFWSSMCCGDVACWEFEEEFGRVLRDALLVSVAICVCREYVGVLAMVYGVCGVQICEGVREWVSGE